MQGRSAQISLLSSILQGPVCPFTFIYGLSNTGKTSAVRLVFSDILETENAAYVDATFCITPRLLFESLIDSLNNHIPSIDNNFEPLEKCGSPIEFVNYLLNNKIESRRFLASVALLLTRLSTMPSYCWT